jgi:hypothetical protein
MDAVTIQRQFELLHIRVQQLPNYHTADLPTRCKLQKAYLYMTQALEELDKIYVVDSNQIW